jgi:hypothetical protein
MARNQIKIGAILSYVQMALSIIVGLSYTPIMIRLLGQSEYGLYSAVSSVTAILSVLNLGFGSAYQRYYSKYKKEIIPPTAKVFVIETSSSYSWYKYVKDDKHLFTVDNFGLSAPKNDILERFKLTEKDIVKRIEELLN